jgi:hypothetical protein
MGRIPLSEECRTCQQRTPRDREIDMNATTHAAIVLDRQRAASLAREVELRRVQAERPDSVIPRRTLIAVVSGWFARSAHAPRSHRAVTSQ